MSEGTEGASSNVGNQPPPGGDNGLIMAQLLQAMQQTQSDLHAQMLQNQVQHRVEAVGDVFTRRVKDFIALGGMKFSGNQDYMEAEKWVQECTALFERMNLTPVQRAEIAAHQMVGTALSWWQSIKTEIDLSVFTWELFLERFMSQFVPLSIKSRLAEQFLKLVQGNLTVREYVNRFNELSRFAPNIIDTERHKNDKFIRGLNPSLAKGVLSVQYQSFEMVMNMALSLEEYERPGLVEKRFNLGQSSNQQQKFQYRKGDRSTPYGRDFGQPRHGFRAHNQQRQIQQGYRPQQLALPAPPVVAAVPEYREPFQPRPEVCFTCGQPGHRHYQCHTREQGGRGNQVNRGAQRGGRGGNRGGRGQQVRPAIAPQARVFAAIGQAPHVQGILYFRDLSLRVLFDTGSSHSFIARSLVDSACLVVSSLDVPICVETPAGGTVVLYDQCRGFQFPFLGSVFTMDLVVLNFKGFQLILGMDWLARNHAIIDCAERTITLNLPGQQSLCHTCTTPGDTVMTSFLFSMEEVEEDVSGIDVVQDFAEVFEEVSTLPPHREVEFRIDLIPGAAPISKAHYRLAPKELEEMRRQLDDSLRKG